jgi:hypothetical protein
MTGEIIYWVDAADVIIAVNEEFSVSRAQHFGNGEDVIGKSLWDFVRGRDTRHLYQLILKKARQTSRALTFAVRCDGPNIRRFTEMTVQQAAAGSVQFSHHTVREESRPLPYTPDEQSSKPGPMVTICSWCLRVELDKKRWAEIEEGAASLGLLNGPPPQFSHAICSDCFAQAEQEIG